jgi:alcohol dehydrogenase (cytochrome c)
MRLLEGRDRFCGAGAFACQPIVSRLLSRRLSVALVLTLIPIILIAQSLDPKVLLKPAIDAWPTYNGDYSGRRFSPLTEINGANIGSLSLAWFYRIASVGPQRKVGNPTIKSTPLMVNGILYFTIPDHAWAIDARTGEEIWHYTWQDKGGHLVGNRGLGMYGDGLYLMTPGCWFVSLNAKDGKEQWKQKIADEKLQYFCTMSPLVVKNHILVGVGGDAMDVPVSSMPAIPKPETCNGAGTPRPVRVNRAPRHGRIRKPWSMAAA